MKSEAPAVAAGLPDGMSLLVWDGYRPIGPIRYD